MNFLARVPNTVDADQLTQLAWRLGHTLKATEPTLALPLGEEAIRKGHALGNYIYVLDIYGELAALRKELPNSRKIDVAFAQIQMGQAQRANDLLRQIVPDSIKGPSERLRYAANEAEALRNFQDREKHQQSIVVLENALRERPEKDWSVQDKRWWLVARHDLARNLHYFAKDVVKARSIFLDVVKKSGAHPVFAYVKAASLRNLSDIYYHYGFGKVAPDEAKAEQYLGDAITAARSTPDTVSLLPEFLYLLAKLQHAQGRTGDAGANIRDAILHARTGGLARVLGLATNKYFWWELGTLTGANCQSFDYFKWQRVEEQLRLLSLDPWVARALVSSRVRAAKCLDFQSKKSLAVGLLQEAKAQLEATSLFAGEGDFRHRWQPVFAGLSLLNAPSPTSGAEQPYSNYDEKIWNELKQIGQRIAGNTNLELTKPQQVWEGVA
jgi:tetratricopeptide (TPR) repeat protein